MSDTDIRHHIRRIKDGRPDIFEAIANRIPAKLKAQLLQNTSNGTSHKESSQTRPSNLSSRIGSSLNPKQGNLSEREAKHLLRRATFSAKPTKIRAITGRSVAQIVDEMMDEARDAPVLQNPDYLNDFPPEDDSQLDAFSERNEGYLFSLWNDIQNGFMGGTIRDRLAFFWSNHFVTSYEEYFLAAFGFRYWQLLHSNALGNFKDFTLEIGRGPAMLIYLNGAENIKQAPNENYARELLELFTLGINDKFGNPNYTEDDIVQVARALTGYWVDFYEMKVNFEPFFHDTGQKTIFGERARFDFDSLHELIFDKKSEQAAWFICSKLYREFVHHEVDDNVVNQMASLFISSGMEIEPVVRALLKSEAFFDSQVVSSKIKSPTEYFTAFWGEMMDELDQQSSLITIFLSFQAGQLLLAPPNVAGWTGGRDWINTSSLPNRWLVMEYFIWVPENDAGFFGFEPFKGLMAELYDLGQSDAMFRVPILLAQHISPVPLDKLDIPPVEFGFGGDIDNAPIPNDIANAPEYIQTLCKRFLNGGPWYEFNFEDRDGLIRMQLFMEYLMGIPEIQLV